MSCIVTCETPEPLVLYVDHEKKELALAWGFNHGLFAPIEVYYRCVKELMQIKKYFEEKGYQYSTPYHMKNSVEPKDGEASILLNITSMPCG